MNQIQHPCHCETCKFLCFNPGMGTPEEIEKLIDNGLADHLTLYSVPKEDHCGSTWHVVMPKVHLSCIFQDRKTGLCMLHDLNAKPLECRLAHCCDDKWIFLNPRDQKRHNKHGNRNIIEDMWDTPEGKRVVKKFNELR